MPDSPENVATKAIADIKAWNAQGFRRARAVLDRKFPDVSSFVFADIDGSSNGPVYELATFLDRIQDLESSPDRKATRKQDHAALEALASRGINEVMFKELRSMLASAQVQATALEAAPADDRTTAITELYLWLRDWRETARAVIKNKSQLRMLGIGGKRAKKAAPQPTPVVTQPPVVIGPAQPAAPQLPAAPVAQLTQGTPATDAAKVA